MKARTYLIALLWLLATATAYAQTKAEKVTVSGQLVCSDCWAEADRKTTPYGTPADLSCARDCAERGIPSAIAVKQGDDYKLYLIEQEQFKQNRDEWLDRIHRDAERSGIFLDREQELEAGNWIADCALCRGSLRNV